MESTVISLLCARRKDFVHASFRGLRFILKFLWLVKILAENLMGIWAEDLYHFDLQNLKALASLRTKVMPFDGYTYKVVRLRV